MQFIEEEMLVQDDQDQGWSEMLEVVAVGNAVGRFPVAEQKYFLQIERIYNKGMLF